MSLEVFAKQRVVEDINGPTYLSYPHFWTASQNYFFIDWHITLTAWLEESGIGKKLRQRLTVFEPLNAQKLVNKSGDYNMSINFFTYVTLRQTKMVIYGQSKVVVDVYFTVGLLQSNLIFL